MDLTLYEVNEAADIISRAAHPEANIIFGAVQDPVYDGKVKITVIATGFDGQRHLSTTPQGRVDYNRSMFYQGAAAAGNGNAPARQPQHQGYGALPATPMNIAKHPTGPLQPLSRPTPPTPVMQEPMRQPVARANVQDSLDLVNDSEDVLEPGHTRLPVP